MSFYRILSLLKNLIPIYAPCIVIDFNLYIIQKINFIMDFLFEPKIISITPIIILIITITIIIIIHCHSNYIILIQLHQDFNHQVITHLHLLFIFPLIEILLFKIMVITFNFRCARMFTIFINDYRNLLFAKMPSDHHENSTQKYLHPLQLSLPKYLSCKRYLCHFNGLSELMNCLDLLRRTRNPRPLLINPLQHLL